MIKKQLLQMQIPRRLEENHRTIVKLAIVASVLFFSVFIAFIRNTQMLVMPAVAVAGVAVILLLLRQPQIGILLIIISTLMVPAPFSVGPTSNINPAMLIQLLLLGLWVLEMFVRERRFHIAPSRTTLPLIVFLIWVTLSLINGQINYYYVPELASISAQVSQVVLYILSGVALLLVANRMVSVVWLRRAVWLFVILSSLYIVLRPIEPLRPYLFRVYQYGADASIFWVWLTAILSSQILFNRQLSKLTRVIMLGVLVFALYQALVRAYSWKSGWLPALMSIAVIVFVGFPKLRAIAVFTAIFVLIMGSSRIGNLVSGGEDYSLSTRSDALWLYLDIIKINPVIGLGPANVYWYTPLFPIRGYAVNYNSHNNYVDIVAQFGLIGLILFFWLAWEIGVLGWRLKDVVRDDFDRAYVIGALGGLAGMLVSGVLGDWIFPFVYNVGLVGYRSSILGWLFLGGLVFLEQIYMRNRNKEATKIQ